MSVLRLSAAMLVLALVACGAGVAIALLRGEPAPAVGSASFRFAEPVANHPEQEQTLRRGLGRNARACERASRSPMSPEYDAVLDATAAIRCEASGLRGATITVYQFSGQDTANDWLRGWLYGRLIRGDCSGRGGQMRWATRAGEERGAILCFDSSATSGARLVWTDNKHKTATVLEGATGTGIVTIHRWWQARFRPETADSRLEVDNLKGLVTAVVAEARCRPMKNISPLSVAGVVCRLPSKGYSQVSELAVERDPSLHLLYAHMRWAGSTLSQEEGSSCQAGPLARGRWSVDDIVAGSLVCYPLGVTDDDGDPSLHEVFLWTVCRSRLFLHFNEMTGDAQRGYRLWVDELAKIGWDRPANPKTLKCLDEYSR